MTLKKLLRSIKKEAKLLRRVVYHRLFINPKLEEDIVNQFTKLYFHSYIFDKVPRWLGVPAIKCPLDLWIYQEIIFEVRPDVIIECGTADGGSAYFLASMCDLVNNGRVITIDIKGGRDRPEHKRIRWLVGSSISGETVDQVKKLIRDTDNIMVILDSDHRKEHVLNELRIYSKLVTQGSYIIVEDTIVNGHPILPDFGPGPMEAVEEFLKGNSDFSIDKNRERFYLTFNPRGYLRREK
ncbi:MAG: cephalosporin hydroxylase [candidate division NC10 bacterium]|nr:cephalosporin hydroxylase [candidate division NC10 bacterium]